MNKYEYVKKSFQKRKAYIDSTKEKPCKRCGGEFPPYCMDYHHRDPEEKKFALGRGGSRHSIKAIDEEIAKCDLLCANCHRIVHYEE